MIKKAFICIGLLFVMLYTGQIQPVYAAAPNVSDCLKGNADCSELDKSIKKSNSDADDSSEETVTGGDNGSLVFNLVKMVFALLLVLALIYLLLKFLNKRNKLFSQVKALENVGGISVGPNKSIQIVRVGSKIYLIGVGDNVEMLQEITDEEVKKDLLNGNQINTLPAGNLFASLFPKKGNMDQSANNQTNTDFKKLFSTELDKLKEGRRKIINQQKKEDKHE